MSWIRVLSVALITAGVGCGGGGARTQQPGDGGDAATEPEVAAGDIADVADEAPGDAPADLFEDADAPAEAGLPEVAADHPAEAAPEASSDLSVEKPPATASWTIAPDPMCTAAGAGCMDTGAVGGYQVTASGTCPGASSVQLWFPGGASAVAAGTYGVKPAAGILDVISMPAGMVGVLAERTDTAAHRFWGRAGTVTVAAVGAARHLTFTGVSLREEGTTAMTTLAADVTCP